MSNVIKYPVKQVTQQTYIGIDNGVSGSVAVVGTDGVLLHYGPTPVVRRLNYTKAKEFLNRVDGVALAAILAPYAQHGSVVIERPMINPMRWTATVSAIRCDEATLIVLESLGMRYCYVDSKEWQKEMLPHRPELKKPAKLFKTATAEEKAAQKILAAAHKKANEARKKETKTLSLEVGKRLFPHVKFSKDADAALMAEWARKTKK